MTLIDGDRIITAQLYDDEHEEFTEEKMSIIDYVNAYTNEGVTESDVIEQSSREQQPCDDAISRQAVFDFIRDNYRRWFINDDAFMQCMKGIKDIVPVTPQPKMGRWVEEDMFDGDVAYRCTNCNEVFSLIDGTPKDNEYNYCPNCGCKMQDAGGEG